MNMPRKSAMSRPIEEDDATSAADSVIDLNQLILVSSLFFLLLLPCLTGMSIRNLPRPCSIVASVLLFLVAVLTIAFELQREFRRIKFMDENNTNRQEPEAPRRWGGEKTIQAFGGATGIVLPTL